MKIVEKQNRPNAKNARQKALLAKLKKEGRLRTGNHEELMKLAGIWKNRTDIDALTIRTEAWTKK